MSRRKKKRELVSIKDCIDTSIKDYIKKSKEMQITLTTNTVNDIGTKRKKQLVTGNGKKITVWIFQTTNKRDYKREDLDMIQKRKPQRITESLSILAQNNAIGTNYICEAIDNTQ